MATKFVTDPKTGKKKRVWDDKNVSKLTEEEKSNVKAGGGTSPTYKGKPKEAPYQIDPRTGEKVEDVYNEAKGRWETPEAYAEKMRPIREAQSQLDEEKRLADIAEAKANLSGLSELEAKQSEENMALLEQTSLMSQASISERNVMAGLSTLNAIAGTFGTDKQIDLEMGKGISELRGADNLIARNAGNFVTGGLTALGKIGNVGFKGFSINTLFSKANNQNVDAMMGDSKDIKTAALQTAQMSLTRGANVQDAIYELEVAEQALRVKANDALLSLSAAPEKVAAGIDPTDEINRNLNAVIKYRQALERYQLTKDPSDVLIITGYPTE